MFWLSAPLRLETNGFQMELNFKKNKKMCETNPPQKPLQLKFDVKTINNTQTKPPSSELHRALGVKCFSAWLAFISSISEISPPS